MREKIKGAFLLIGILLLSACSLTESGSVQKADSAVKVITIGGHGTGVHIGDGYIVTAAHVLSGAGSDVSLKLSDGKVQPGHVLWVNKEYDVALIKTSPTMYKSILSCTTPNVGDHISAYGNPLKLEFVRTYGKVAGKAIELEAWKQVMPVDMVIIMGMSGGPVFDSHDRVVGIAVGVVTYATGLTGVGMIVPGSTVCNLLAKD